MPLFTFAKPITVDILIGECDFCGEQAARGAILPQTLTIHEKPGILAGQSKPYEQVPKASESIAISVLTSAGWTFESFHGKKFLSCPKCAAL